MLKVLIKKMGLNIYRIITLNRNIYFRTDLKIICIGLLLSETRVFNNISIAGFYR